MAETTETLIRRARAFRGEGLLEAAVAIRREILAREPHNLVFQHDLAAALGDVGRNAEAAEIARRAVADGLRQPETFLVLARALSGSLQLDAAEGAYREALRLAPNDPTAHRELAQLVWMRTGDPMKAQEALAERLAADSDLVSLQIIRAEICGQMGDLEAQADILHDLMQRFGRHPEILYYAARAALARKDAAGALEFAAAAAAGAPEEDDAASVYATALLAAAEPRRALNQIERLRARQPVNQLYIALQATAWRLLGDARYGDWFDYDRFVFSAPIGTPRGWASGDAYLEDLRASLMEAHRFKKQPFFQSVRDGGQISSITKCDDPAMRAFPDAARGPLEAYLDRLGRGDDPLRARRAGGATLVDAWSVLLPTGGYHVSHVHPAGWLSSACHLQTSENDPGAPMAGWLKFGEPGCLTTPALEAQRFVEPEAGRIVIFPSYMWHGVIPFTKGRDRLTVAADFAPAQRR